MQRTMSLQRKADQAPPKTHHTNAASGQDFLPLPVYSPTADVAPYISASQEIVNWKSGDLTLWCLQGVFLINTALTVRSGDAGSHATKSKTQAGHDAGRFQAHPAGLLNKAHRYSHQASPRPNHFRPFERESFFHHAQTA